MLKADVVKLLDKYPILALAVSGGSDSMALLFWFCKNRPKDSFYVINVEHGIRGDASVQDSAFVYDFCKEYGIECKIYNVDAPSYSKENGLTLEEGARMLRHNILKEECLTKAYAVATAHHLDDQAESVFMHLARGCGINGLRGMGIEDGHLIRPLINTAKAEIMEYIAKNNIPYRIDLTNEQTQYSRNFVRKEIFPLVEKKFGNFTQKLAKLSLRARETSEFIASLLPSVTREHNTVILNLQNLHEVLKREMFYKAIALLGVEADIEDRHIVLLISMEYENNGAKIDLPHQLTAYKEYENIAITRRSESNFHTLEFAVGEFEWGDYTLRISQVEKMEKDGALYCDGDSINKNCVIRIRQPKDYITTFGGVNKSLGDFFTDKKFPLRLREIMPVIALENEIFAIFGLDIGKKIAVKKDSKNILKLEIL